MQINDNDLLPKVKPRNLMIVEIDARTILSMIISGQAWQVVSGMPPDTALLDIRTDMESAPGTVYLVVEHPTFPECLPGERMHHAPQILLRKVTVNEEGHEITDAVPDRPRRESPPLPIDFTRGGTSVGSPSDSGHVVKPSGSAKKPGSRRTH